MRTLPVLAVLAAGLLAAPASADDKEKKDKAPTGAYTRKAGDLNLKMEFKKDNVVVYHVNVGDVGCVMTSKYTKEKDGTYKCEVTEFEKKGDFPEPKEKGYKFSFKIEVKDKKVTLSNLNGEGISDDARQAVEGDYDAAAGD